MKLAELEQEARTEMVVEERKAEDKAEEFRQKVIAWFSAKLDLDVAELQKVVSKVNTWAGYFGRGTALSLNVPKHEPVFFEIEETNGQLRVIGCQYMIGHRARPVYDLGAALVVAADEWEKGERKMGWL